MKKNTPKRIKSVLSGFFFIGRCQMLLSWHRSLPEKISSHRHIFFLCGFQFMKTESLQILFPSIRLEKHASVFSLPVSPSFPSFCPAVSFLLLSAAAWSDVRQQQLGWWKWPAALSIQCSSPEYTGDRENFSSQKSVDQFRSHYTQLKTILENWVGCRNRSGLG